LGSNTIKIAVKVVPGSSKTCIAGWLGEILRIRVAAPPERGKANTAVEALITQLLGLSKGAVRIVKGKKSARKVVEIDSLSLPEIRRRFEENIG